jgi:hypothetical protein
MSTRTTRDEELIVGPVAGHHPSHAQNTSPTSSLTTHSNVTARLLHERWEYALYVST